LNTDLIDYWPFNGNANDESGNENHSNGLGASLTEDRFGNVNIAYDFEGVDDYIIAEDDDSLEYLMIFLLVLG
jgi:hypothetical protein